MNDNEFEYMRNEMRFLINVGNVTPYTKGEGELWRFETLLLKIKSLVKSNLIKIFENK